MTAVIGVLLLVALFVLFSLIERERNSGGCAAGGCWKKRVGFGCGGCPLESAGAGTPNAHADERPGDGQAVIRGPDQGEDVFTHLSPGRSAVDLPLVAVAAPSRSPDHETGTDQSIGDAHADPRRRR